MKSRLTKRRVAAVAGLAAVLGTAAGVTVIQAQSTGVQRAIQTHVSSAGAPSRATAIPTLPGETREQYRQRLLQQGGGRIYDIRDETRGKRITLGGKSVQLPPDAYVDGIVTDSLCAGIRTDCEVPFYNIRRGSSLINVGERSGRVISEHLAPGEERAFDFLKEALR